MITKKVIMLKKAILIDTISDHLPIFSMIKAKKQTNNVETIHYRNFSKLNISKLLKDATTEFSKVTNIIQSNTNPDINSEF